MENSFIPPFTMKLRDAFFKNLEYRDQKKPSIKRLISLIFFDINYSVVFWYRLACYFNNKQNKYLKSSFRTISQIILTRLSRKPGIEFKNKIEIGWGLMIAHPHDIVIGAGAVVGENVTIYNGVTLGAKMLKKFENDNLRNRYPIIEKNTTIFTGSKIIGHVSIG